MLPFHDRVRRLAYMTPKAAPLLCRERLALVDGACGDRCLSTLTCVKDGSQRPARPPWLSAPGFRAWCWRSEPPRIPLLLVWLSERLIRSELHDATLCATAASFAIVHTKAEELTAGLSCSSSFWLGLPGTASNQLGMSSVKRELC